MAVKEKYKIMVGERILSEVKVGILNKDRSKITETVSEMLIPSPAKIISNYFPVWARRISSADKDKVNVDVMDADYKGELEFLTWGDEKGQEIFVRHLTGTKSLDAKYQELRLKMTPKDDDAMIVLEAGQNEFDYRTQPSLIDLLKIHYKHKGSKSKDPKYKTFLYWEVDNSNKEKATKKIEQSVTGAQLVMSLDMKPANLRSLFNIMGGVKVMPTVMDIKNDTQVYTALLELAHGKGEYFSSKIDSFKREISDAFVKFESYNALDLTLNGTITITSNGKKLKILENVPAKGESMKDYVMQNYHDPNVYDAINQLKINSEKLK